MADLLDLLGDEWSIHEPITSEGRIPPTAKPAWVRHVENYGATHGCAECGLAPATWSEAYGCYIDGMGRITRCGYCPSCAGSGWVLLRDPWTGAPASSWHAVPCRYCYGGWQSHAWDCNGHKWEINDVEPQTVTVYGVRADGMPFFPGEVVAPDPRLCIA